MGENKNPKRTAVEKAVDQFLRVLRERNASAHTIKAYAGDLDCFAGYFGSRDWTSIDHLVIRLKQDDIWISIRAFRARANSHFEPIASGQNDDFSAGPVLWTDTPGTRWARSLTSLKPCSCISAPVSTDRLTGTVCASSDRFCAVTTISCNSEAP